MVPMLHISRIVFTVSVAAAIQYRDLDANDGEWPQFFDANHDLCDLQRVHGPSWFAEAGCKGESCAGKMPKEPMIFTGLIDSWPALNMTWDFSTISQNFGDISLELYDEWQQAGGNLHLATPAEFADISGSLGAPTIKEIIQKFKAGHKGQHEDFYCGEVGPDGKDRNGDDVAGRASVDCKMSLCCQLRKRGLIDIPKELEGDTFLTGQSFSLSPEGGGFAMHTHAGAWLGLVAGEKAWFVEHPDRVGPDQPWYSTVLPLVLPTRSWAKEVVQFAKGRRPLFCIQRPGEVFYLPDAWWHATINRGDFAMGYGSKPVWFNPQYKQLHNCDGNMAQCTSPGDQLADKSRNMQTTSLPQILDNGHLAELRNFENLVVGCANAEQAQDRKSSRLRQDPGPSAHTAATSLCILGANLFRMEGVDARQLGNSVVDEAYALDAKNYVCERVAPHRSTATAPATHMIPKRQIAPSVWMPEVVFGVGGLKCGQHLEAREKHDEKATQKLEAQISHMTMWWAELGGTGFDTSTEYGYNLQLGQTINDMHMNGEQFIVYKVDSARDPDSDVHAEIESALAEIGVKTLDVAMIHEPQGERSVQIWRELEKEVINGRVRALGVSNFDEAQMQEILNVATVPLSLNQREMSLKLRDTRVLEACNRLNVTYQAYSPLGQGWHGVLEEPVVQKVAARNRRSPAQIALRWLLQKGASLSTQSTSKEHMSADMDLWSWELSARDMNVLDTEVEHSEGGQA